MNSVDKMSEIGSYCKNFIEKICNEIGYRPSCSINSRKAAFVIKNELEKYCDEVIEEEFYGYPGFMKPLIGYPMWSTILYIIAVLEYLYYPLLSLIFSILAIYVSVFKLFALEEYDFFYYLYPKQKGLNIIGKMMPSNEPKKLVIFGGHHDSAYIFPLYVKWKEKVVYFIYLIVVFAIIFVTLTILRIIYKNFIFNQNILTILNYLIILPLIGSILIIIFGLFFISTRKSLGANDNLSAVSVCLAVAKELKSKMRLKQTELWFVSFDSEESGMRGSKLFVKRRLNELKNRLTACINFDIIGVDEIILLPTKESMYRATHSPQVYNKFKKAADNLGIPVKIEKQSFGGTDSAPFSRKKLNAASVLRLTETGFPTVWHSPNDIPENIDEKKLEEMVKITLEFVSLIDNE